MARERTIILLGGDYAERIDASYGAAQAAYRDEESGNSAPLTVGETSAYVTLKSEYEALKAEAEEHGTKVTLRALTRQQWRDLKAAHPPRTEGDEEAVKADRVAGVNTDTCDDDLVAAALVEPSFKSRAAFDEWAGDLAEADWRFVMQTAWALVTESRFDPKALPASPTRN